MTRLASTQRHRWRNLSAGKKIGSFIGSLDKLDDKLIHWLVDNTPDGSTVTEFLMSIAVDAYNEEKNQ